MAWPELRTSFLNDEKSSSLPVTTIGGGILGFARGSGVVFVGFVLRVSTGVVPFFSSAALAFCRVLLSFGVGTAFTRGLFTLELSRFEIVSYAISRSDISVFISESLSASFCEMVAVSSCFRLLLCLSLAGLLALLLAWVFFVSTLLLAEFWRSSSVVCSADS